jgi:hypothetical protein
MPHITVRRYQADAERSKSDFDLRSEDLRHLDRRLQEVLRSAQAERGVGLWSDADPELWVGHTFVGRLGRGGDIARLARQAMEDLDALVGRAATR